MQPRKLGEVYAWLEPKYKIAAIPQRQTVEWCPITPYVDLDQYQPRSQGSFLPALRSERERERERETLENAGHVSLRIWEITNKRFGGGAGECEICLYRA